MDARHGVLSVERLVGHLLRRAGDGLLRGLPRAAELVLGGLRSVADFVLRGFRVVLRTLRDVAPLGG